MGFLLIPVADRGFILIHLFLEPSRDDPLNEGFSVFVTGRRIFKLAEIAGRLEITCLCRLLQDRGRFHFPLGHGHISMPVLSEYSFERTEHTFRDKMIQAHTFHKAPLKSCLFCYQIPAFAFRISALSVFSHGNPASFLPKCPYAAVAL